MKSHSKWWRLLDPEGRIHSRWENEPGDGRGSIAATEVVD